MMETEKKDPKEWTHKDAFFYKAARKALTEASEIVDLRGAEYDVHGDGFLNAPTVFLDATRNHPTESNNKLALRLAVLCDVKLQRIQGGRAKRDSFIDLMAYVGALAHVLTPAGPTIFGCPVEEWLEQKRPHREKGPEPLTPGERAEINKILSDHSIINIAPIQNRDVYGSKPELDAAVTNPSLFEQARQSGENTTL